MAPATRKITVLLPEELLRKAQQSTGKGVTDTIRDGLRLVAAGDANRTLQRLRGKVKLSVNLRRLRDDRR
jgi:Arc/MetJ-type ribon-helix-helix transcriptional regulator